MTEWKLPAACLFDGRTVRYGVSGDGPSIVAVHGTPWSSFNLRHIIDPVAVAPWGSSFFRHVHAHEASFAGVPDYIHEDIVRAYVKTAAFKPIDDATLDAIVLPWTGSDGRAAFYRQIAQANSGYTDAVQPLYARISRLFLILWGREDTWIPLERGEALRDMIPGSSLHVIPDAGHLVIEEQPDQLINKIHPFIQNEDIPSQA